MKPTKILSILAVALVCPLVIAEEKPVAKEATADATLKKPSEPSGNSIAGHVRRSANFSILAKAMDAAGLTETFAGNGPYTVFAPTDDAFMKLPKESLMKLMMPENKEKLRSLLLYHVIAGDVPASSLADGKVKSVNGEPIKIDVGKAQVKADDAKVVNVDVKAENGTIHVLDHVMVPKSLDGFADLKAD